MIRGRGASTAPGSVALYVGPNGNAWNKHGNRNLWDEILMGCHKGERVTKEGSTGYTIPGGFSRTFRNDCNGGFLLAQTPLEYPRLHAPGLPCASFPPPA